MRVISRYDTTKHNNPLSESLYNRGKPDSEIQPEQREGGGKSIDSREPMGKKFTSRFISRTKTRSIAVRSFRYHKMVEIAAYKDSLARKLTNESNEIKRLIKK